MSKREVSTPLRNIHFLLVHFIFLGHTLCPPKAHTCSKLGRAQLIENYLGALGFRRMLCLFGSLLGNPAGV